MDTHPALNLEAIECADLCLQCANICRETEIYCLEQGITCLNTQLIRLLTTCIGASETTRNLLLQNSPDYLDTSQRSAEACSQAAQALERFSDDVVLKHCAEVCNQCANACRRHGTLFHMEEISHTPSLKKLLY